MLENSVGLLIAYKYILLFPIALIEGPIITIISGFLAQLGYLNIYIAAAIIVVADNVGDVILYELGKRKGYRFVTRWGKYVGITPETIATAKEFFHKYHGWILFMSKLTGAFGFIIPILFTAGMVGIPFKRYMAINIIGEMIWTTSLIIVGYFFGSLYGIIDSITLRIMLGVLIIVLVILVIRLRNYFKHKVIHP